MNANLPYLRALLIASLAAWSCASEPHGDHPMAEFAANRMLWAADVPSLQAAQQHVGLLDSLGQSYTELRALADAMKVWPDERGLVSVHRIGAYGTSWMVTSPRGNWQPAQLREPYEARTYSGFTLYEGSGWAAAASDAVLWLANSDLLIEEVLRAQSSRSVLDAETRELLALLPEGGIAFGRDHAEMLGIPQAIALRWDGPRSLRSDKFTYPDSLRADVARSGRVMLPAVDSATISVAGNSIRIMDNERELEAIGAGQGVWRTYIRRAPFVMASWQQWADSSTYLPHWTGLDAAADRWVTSYPQYAYTKSYGTTWVSTDDTLRFVRSVAFALMPAAFDGNYIQADLLRGQGGDLWTLREDDGRSARWTFTWKPWPAQTASRPDQSAEGSQPQSGQ